MRKLLCTVALAALATAAVHADPGGGKGQGGGKENGGAKDQGGYQQAKGQDQREGHSKNDNRGQSKSADRAADRGGNKQSGQNRSDDRRDIAAPGNQQGRFEQRGDNDQGRFGRDQGADGPRLSWRDYDRRGLINGCPPGLAKKNNGCMPPGHAKRWQVGQPLARNVVYYEVPAPLVTQFGPAPTGYRYVRVDDDILLISKATRVIVDALLNK